MKIIIIYIIIYIFTVILFLFTDFMSISEAYLDPSGISSMVHFLRKYLKAFSYYFRKKIPPS